MSESIEQNLLAGIPTGDEIRDPREGDHLSGTISGVELYQYPKSGGWAVQVTWGNLTDSDGKAFQYRTSYTIPTSESEDFIHRIFLATAHNFGIVPRGVKNRIYANDEAARDIVLQAFKTIEGSSQPISLSTDGKGYLREKFLKKA